MRGERVEEVKGSVALAVKNPYRIMRSDRFVNVVPVRNAVLEQPLMEGFDARLDPILAGGDVRGAPCRGRSSLLTLLAGN